MTQMLIVEDSPTQAAQLRLILEREGFEVTTAVDGREALEHLTAHKFDMVISDIVMPGMSGYELCHRIKSSGTSPEMPVILLSTLNDPMDIIRGLECEADNFITKPYEPQQLVSRIRNVLQNRHIRSQSKLSFGVEVMFLGKKFVIGSEKEQILDLLIATFEDIVRTNRGLQERESELAAAKEEIESYAQGLELRVRQRTAELLEHQKQLAEAQAIAHLGNWRLDLARGRLEWSDEMYRIFGLDRQDFAHTTEALAACVHPDDRGKFSTFWTRAIQQRSSLRSEFRILRRDGEERLCWIEGSCQSDPKGEAVALFGICQDVTERKMMEQQLHQAIKMEAVGQLTGGIAHDFNNLLTIVIANLDALETALADRPEGREFAKAALSASLAGAGLTRQLLAFSRKQQLQARVINLNELVADTTALLRRTLGETVAVKTVFAEDLWLTEVDSGQFESALVNLAINARDAMPGGGQLTIETSNKMLDSAYARENPDTSPGEYVMVAVSDTGIGIPAANLSRVFDPFFTTKDVGKGTGLGLSMVYGFVKQSGGHVKVYSEEGFGTTIRLYLPKAASGEKQEIKPAAAEPEAPVPEGKVVLVVDDNEDVREVVVNQLQRLGYRVVEAESGAAALAVLEDGSPIDVLFTDIVMPGGMSGLDLACRARELKPELGILLTSGFSEAALQSSATIDGSVGMLSKPYRMKELGKKIAEVLATRQEK